MLAAGAENEERGTSRRLRIRWAAGIGRDGTCRDVRPGADRNETQTCPLRDTGGLIARGTKAEAVAYLGREAVRRPSRAEIGPGHRAAAVHRLPDGVIEADLALRIPKPPGFFRFPGFVDRLPRPTRPSHYEVSTWQPGNSDADGPGAAQTRGGAYSSAPGFHLSPSSSLFSSRSPSRAPSWLRDAGRKSVIELAGRAASCSLNGSARPTLVGETHKARKPAARPSPHGRPRTKRPTSSNVRNHGGRAVGPENRVRRPPAVAVRFSGDGTGRRDHEWSCVAMRNVVGTCPAAGRGGRARGHGTWHHGYVELSFGGSGRRASRQGRASPSTCILAVVDRRRCGERADARGGPARRGLGPAQRRK